MEPASPTLSTVSQNRPTFVDLELLRREITKLEKQISNIVLVRIALLILIIFVFSSATIHRSKDAIQDTIEAIDTIVNSTDTLDKKPLDPISMFFSTPSWSQPNEKRDGLTLKLKDQYTQILTVNFTVLGTSLSFDLRLLILSLPVWVAFSHFYLAILREKRRLILIVGDNLNSKLPPGRVAALDRLVFGLCEGPYNIYPTVLIDRSFWVGVIVLLALMIKTTHFATSSQGKFDWFTTSDALQYVFCFWFYLQLLTSRYLIKLQRQVEEKLQCIVPPDRFRECWDGMIVWLYSSPARIKPFVTIRTGAALILFTLVLPTAVVGCGHTYPKPVVFAAKQAPDGHGREVRPGYQLINHHADWPEDDFAGNLARYYYDLIVVTALAAILLCSFKQRTSAAYRRIVFTLTAIGLAASTFAIVVNGELFLMVYLYLKSPTLIYIWIGIFCVAVWLPLILFLLPSKLQERRAVHRIHLAVRVYFVPVVFADLLYLGSLTWRLPGMVVLYLGTILITFGFFALLHSIKEHKLPSPAPV